LFCGSQISAYYKTTTLLDQKLASTQLHYADAEEQHQKELQQYSIELENLKDNSHGVVTTTRGSQ